MKTVLRYLMIALVCAAAVAAAGYYVFDPKFAKAAKTAASKEHAEGERATTTKA